METDLYGRSVDDLVKENDILRGIVAKVGGACLHCGLEDKSKCRSGFPGCSWADDLLCGEEVAVKVMLEKNKKLTHELRLAHDLLNEVETRLDAKFFGGDNV